MYKRQTGRVIDTVPQATERDIERAVEAAVRGQKEWEKVPVWKRGEILYRFLDIVEQNKEELAQTLCSENGKPIVEARAEIANIKISFSAFIEQAKHYYGSIIPAGQEQGQETNLQLVTREAIGVVAVSYTHLDVYKRQRSERISAVWLPPSFSWIGNPCSTWEGNRRLPSFP